MKKRLVEIFLGDHPNITDLWLQILDHYKKRSYHNLKHISECLSYLDNVKGFIDDYECLTIAILFHDIIYDPKSSLNEKNSADFCLEHMKLAGKTEEQCKNVHDLILITSQHKTQTENDKKYMVDIDLSILGSSPERYSEYTEQVRKEYNHVSDSVFNFHRLMFIDRLLIKGKIFQTDYFYELLNKQAITNLMDEKLKIISK